MVPGSGGWQGKGPVARSTGSVAPPPSQRAVEEGWNKSGATRSGNVSDDTATITVRPMTASQSQKSKGGFFGSVIMKGTPEQASGSRSQAAKAPSRLLGSSSVLSGGIGRRSRSGILPALAWLRARSMLDRQRENRPADRLRQVGVQHHPQATGPGLGGRDLEGRRLVPRRRPRAARAEQGIQPPADFSELEIETGFLQCIHRLNSRPSGAIVQAVIRLKNFIYRSLKFELVAAARSGRSSVMFEAILIAVLMAGTAGVSWLVADILHLPLEI